MVNFVPAVSFNFCLALPAAFTQPGDYLVAEPCRMEGQKRGHIESGGRGSNISKWRPHKSVREMVSSLAPLRLFRGLLSRLCSCMISLLASCIHLRTCLAVRVALRLSLSFANVYRAPHNLPVGGVNICIQICV